MNTLHFYAHCDGALLQYRDRLVRIRGQTGSTESVRRLSPGGGDQRAARHCARSPLLPRCRPGHCGGGRRTVAQLDLVRRRPHHDVSVVVHNHALAGPAEQGPELAHARDGVLQRRARKSPSALARSPPGIRKAVQG